MKRILAFLLAFLMLFSSVPVEVLALSFTNKEEGLTFSNTENGLTFNQASPASDEGLQTAAEEKGLPVHFFVTTLTEAQKVRNGDYKRYKENLWGKKDGSSGIYAIPTVLEGETGKAINSANGIRAHMVENDIITYVAQWPEGGADTFRKFTETYTIGNTPYSGEKYEVQWVTICARNDGASWFGGESWKRCGCGANYDHIHIDGILTQKVELQPQTLNLQKQITKAQSTEQTFRFKLYRLGLDTQYKPTDQIVGDSVAEFVATIPAGETSAPIVLSSNANISTGYYKLVEEASIGWEQSGVAIDNDPGSALYIQFLDSNTGNNTVKYSKNANTGYKAANLATITNEPQPTRNITVKKTWVDADNQDGIRPDSVKVHLLINGSHFGVTQTLSASNNWEATWTNVPDSSSYSYNVEEELPAGYSYTIAGNAANGFTLTNTHVPEKTTVYAHKQWDDDNNRDGSRPDHVMLQLYAGSTKVGNPVSVSAEDNWQTSWKDLPVKARGEVITYSVKEETVPQYYVNDSVTINGQSVTYPSYTTDNGVFIVTNKKELETTSLKVTKIWDDSNNQDNKRPTSITLNLFADGTPVPGANGQPITITVTPGAEKPVVFSANPKTSSGTEVPLKGDVTVNGNQWEITITGLLKHVSGGARREIPYSVTEAPVEDYTTNYAAATDTAGNQVINQWTITNTHTPANCEIQVTKSWVDGENQDGIRPVSVTVSVKKGSTVVDTITLRADTNWAGKSSPLPKFENGVDISDTYTVEETSYQMADGTTGNLVQNADGTATIPAPERHTTGYTAVISGSAAAGYTITNTHTPAVIKITATKHWEDMNNNDGIRPYAVVVDLRKNGEKIDSATLKGNGEDNALSESKTWENMPRYQNGVAITYTVEEVAHYKDRSKYDDNTPDFIIPEGYSAYHFYSTQNPDHFTALKLEYGPDHLHALVVNKYTPAVTDLNIQKIWDDDNNRDGERPESLTFHVWKTTTNPDTDMDGLVSVAPSETEGWTKVTTVEMKPGAEGRWLDLTVSNLPKYDNKQPIYYSVTEEVPAEYTASYVLNLNRNIVTVTNTKQLDTTSITVTKQWEDNSNQDGKRPDGVIMTLYSGGTTMKDGNGNPITLTITENNGTVTGTLSGNGRTPTNKDVPLTVTSADSDADHWRVTIGGLLANAYDKEGVSSVYSVAETGYIKNGVTNYSAISGYTSSGIGNAGNNYTIVNSHTAETVDIPVLKSWDDKENQDGIRPASVSVSLQTSTDNGVTWTTHTDAKYRKELTLRGNWMGTFEDMPRYENGKEIKYKVVEDTVNGYTLQENNTVWNGTTVTLTNKHTPETTSVTATKIWNDNGNVDNKRPTSVTFHLLNDKGHMGEAYKAVLRETASGTTNVGDTGVTIAYSKNAQGNWTVTWENLPKYNGRDPIDYKVQEEAPANQYSASTKREDGIIYITNTRAQDTTNVSMIKLWDDDFNRDGKRPQSIQVSLKANGVVLDGKTVTLNAANHWKHTWENLPVNGAAGPIEYKIEEVTPSDPDYDYKAEYITDSETQSLVIKNSRELDRTTLSVIKKWEDNNNQDNKRPTSITLNLLYNGIPVPGADGHPITITVTPNAENPGTETPVVFSAAGKTPTDVVVPLEGSVKVVGNEWQITISNLLKHVTGGIRQASVYSVTEDPVEDYTTAYSTVTSDSGNTITITNTHVPEKITIPVKKVWQDDENRDGIRPESVTVSIKRNGETLQSLELKASNNWSGTFAPLSKYENGVDISTEYTVEETKYRMAGQTTSQSLVEDEESGEFVIPAQNNRFTGYTPTVTGSVTEGFTVTNTHEVDKIKVSVTNQWDDAENNDNKRPHAVVMELRKNGVTINSATLDGTSDSYGLTYTWEKDSSNNVLYRYEAGVVVTYTVVETSHYNESGSTITSSTPEGYTIDHFYSAQNPELFDGPSLEYSQNHTHVLVVNYYKPEEIALNIQKSWDDDDNRDGSRPGSLTFQVWRTTAEEPDTDGKVDGIFHLPPSTTNGWEEAYRVPVASNPDNSGSEGSGDTGDQAAKIIATMTKDDLGRWYDVTVTGLPKYDNGQRVYYGVTEGAVDKYTPRYALNLNRDIVTVTNTKPLETTSITVTKQWEDSNDQDGMRPAGIILTLYSDGTKMKDAEGKDVTLTIRNDGTAQISGTAKSPSGVTTQLSVDEISTTGDEWSVKINGLLENAEDKVGVPTVYSFTETGYIVSTNPDDIKSGSIPGYTMVDSRGTPISTAVASNGTVTIINKHTPATTEIPVVKTWSDNGNQDGKRPESVSLHLETERNGTWEDVLNAENQPVTITLNAAGNWMGKFENVTRYKDGGTSVRYRVVETAVPDYNLVEGVAQPITVEWTSGTVTINNVHTPETVDITAKKVWDDADNADKKRPETVTFHLLDDKGHMGQNYMATLSANATDPAAVGTTGVTREYGSWTVTWKNLPKYNGGQKIDYVVQESPLMETVDGKQVSLGYEASYRRDTDGSIIVTNKRAQDTTDITVNKVWDDDFNRDGERPESIEVKLFGRDTQNALKTETLNAGNHWKFIWDDLPVNDAQGPIPYSVQESKVDGYKDPVYTSDHDALVITNSRELEKTTLSIVKKWEDNNNQDGKRPGSITLNLLYNGIPVPGADGKPVTITVTENSVTSSSNPKTPTGVEVELSGSVQVVGNEWHITIENLLKHVTGAVRQEIVYSVTEVPVSLYTTSYPVNTTDSARLVTNTHVPVQLTIPVKKDWVDDNNRDGIRPESVTVSLKRAGSIVQSVELNVGNNWTNAFTGIPQYENGEDISDQYTVEETAYRMAEWKFTKVMETPGVIPAQNGRFNGYTATVSGSVKEGFTVTNTHQVDKIKVSVTNQWDDYNDNDGKRPYAVEVELRKNGTKINSATLAGTSATHQLSHTWEELYRYEAGVIITYTVVETSHYTKDAPTILVDKTPVGYSIDHFYSTQNPEKFTNVTPNHLQALIINQYTPARTSLNIQKKWVDDNDRDGKRPVSLTFQVWATKTEPEANEKGISTVVPGGSGWGQVTQVTMTRGVDGQWWDVTVPDLPMYHEGGRIYYGVTEIGHTVLQKDNGTTVYNETIPDGYNVSYELNAKDDVVTVTNTHTPKIMKVTAKKVWDDDNNRDKVRPDSVTVRLYANGIPTNEVQTLSDSNNWRYTWKDLYAYYMGAPVSYDVVEDAVEFYEASYSKTTDDKGDVEITVTNAHTPETVTVQVSNVWSDDDNRDNVRPESVTVAIMSGDEVVDSFELHAGNYWTGVSEELPKHAFGKVGQEIIYTVKEIGYRMAGWSDTKTLTEPNKIPAQDDHPTGYTASIAEVSDYTFTVTNVHNPELVELKANKVWEDDNNRDGKRPEEITLHLLADNVHMGENHKLVANAANGWSVTWTGTDLYKYNYGEPIQYTVMEEFKTKQENTASENTGAAVKKIEDYLPAYKQDSNNPYLWTVTNTYRPETTEVTVTKVWDDDNNRDGIRPKEIKVRLMADGNETDNTIILSEDNNWVNSWTNLPKNRDQGTPIVYTVQETTVSAGYEPKVVRDPHLGANYFVLTNKHVPQTTGVSVTKIWNDEDNRDGMRPEGLLVQLYANNEPIPGTKALLDENNEWAYTWNSTTTTPLYIYQTQWNDAAQDYETTKIRYSVLEVGYMKDGQEYPGIPEGYKGSAAGEGTYAITLTNTHDSKKITLTLHNVWNDNNNNDGIRPSSIAVTLKQGERSQRNAVIVTPDSNWTHMWSDLYRYQGGVPIDYFIDAPAVEGYTTTYSKQTDDATGNITIILTHTHADKELEMSVTKVWRDNNNLEGVRPGSVSAQLYKNGEAYGDKITLSADNKWSVPVSLPVYENGVEISWTVKELRIPRYYSVSYDQSTLTITNTIQSKEVPKTGDFNNLGIWMLLFGGCCAGSVTVLLWDKKKKNK